MRLVVADTGSLNYLVLIEQIELLPALFEKVFVPQAVEKELRHDEAPAVVRRWIAEPPTKGSIQHFVTSTTANELRSNSRFGLAPSSCSSTTAMAYPSRGAWDSPSPEPWASSISPHAVI